MWPLRRGWVWATIGLGIAGILGWDWAFQQRRAPDTAGTLVTVAPNGVRTLLNPEFSERLSRLNGREDALERGLWAPELKARRHGRVIEAFWDRLNRTTNRWGEVLGVEAGEWLVPRMDGPPEDLGHGVERFGPAGGVARLSPAEWRGRVKQVEADGWTLLQSEFRHVEFRPEEGEPGAESTFQFSAHLVHPVRGDRLAVEGPLVIGWTARDGEQPGMSRIDASRLRITLRRHGGVFVEKVVDRVQPPVNAYSVDPLIVEDLDNDGVPELVLAGRNRVYRRGSDGRYEGGALCRVDPGLISCALIADFDGDGFLDLLTLRHEGLFLRHGDGSGRFDGNPEQVWKSSSDLRYPMVMSCGDVDGDGAQDVFIGQYRVPYENGSMPTPGHDADDGYPAMLLRNDGHGRFTRQAQHFGTSPHQHRRTYSASLVDLRGLGLLDVVVAGDFSGADIWEKASPGGWKEATAFWGGHREGFGMAHAFGDFDRDGRLDVLMIGMTSPTVDRLESLNLWRTGNGMDREMRRRMTHGNRLFLGASREGASAGGGLGDSIARSGWSWGCAAVDLDNDGFQDVCIGNGLESRESVEDYEREYWLHDAYVGDSQEDPLAYQYFKAKFARTRGQGMSYGGYEKNRLFMNQSATNFVELGHVLGFGLEEDTRNLVADDLDGDGRMDVVLTSFAVWPDARQLLRVYENRMENPGGWIGFRFVQGPGLTSASGVRVEVEGVGWRTVRVVATGDSYRSQQAYRVHVGLGRDTRVLRVRFSGPGLVGQVLENPAADRYHEIRMRRNPALPAR